MSGGAERGLAALVGVSRGIRRLVVGDALLDVFERGRAARLAPDAAVPVVTDVRGESCPGGAANVAANLATLGPRVTLLSAAGEAGAGAGLLEKRAGIGAEVREVGR